MDYYHSRILCESFLITKVVQKIPRVFNKVREHLTYQMIVLLRLQHKSGLEIIAGSKLMMLCTLWSGVPIHYVNNLLV